MKIAKKACSINDKIFGLLLAELRKGRFRTELEIYNFLKQKTKESKCRLAFKPIVATGKNAAEVHHKAKNVKLKNDFLVVDFGVRYKNFCCDCTRTFYIGNPSKKEREIYKIVLDAQLTAVGFVFPGMNCGDIDAIARAALGDYMKYFVHGLGHGVGKKIHQSPNLKPNNRYYLKKGMILTIEPGVYLKNRFGIRIEDTVLVKDRAVVLTRFRKNLVCV